MDGFFDRLWQREIVQWALAYLAGAFALLQATDIIGQRFGWPEAAVRILIVALAVGWTTHHSICEFRGNWYLFYHDAILSGGESHLRSVKVTELRHDAHGRIATIHPYGE